MVVSPWNASRPFLALKWFLVQLIIEEKWQKSKGAFAENRKDEKIVHWSQKLQMLVCSTSMER